MPSGASYWSAGGSLCQLRDCGDFGGVLCDGVSCGGVLCGGVPHDDELLERGSDRPHRSHVSSWLI